MPDVHLTPVRSCLSVTPGMDAAALIHHPGNPWHRAVWLPAGLQGEGSRPSGVSREMPLQDKVLVITHLHSSSSRLEMHCSLRLQSVFQVLEIPSI